MTGGLRQAVAARGQRRASDQRALQYRAVAQQMAARRRRTVVDRARRSVY